MVELRSMVVVLVIFLGLACAGCSPGAVQDATREDGRSQTEAAGRERPKTHWWLDESFVSELEMTEGQVDAVKRLMDQSSKESGEQRQLERQLSLRLLRALSQEPYDTAVVDRMSDRMTEVYTQEHQRRIRNVRMLRDILSQEQWTKLWETRPRALQIGRFRVMRGPKVTVTSDQVAAPTPAP